MSSDRHNTPTQDRLRVAFQSALLQVMGLQSMAGQVFLLCEIHDLTTEETAAILGITPTAVHLQLADAHREISSRRANTTLPSYLAS
jgi:DNA-directed RNA polymerase specialized sigma24 family protein